MPEGLSSPPKKLRLGRMPAGVGPSFKAWLDSTLRQMGRALGVQVQIDGAESASTGSDGSLRFKINPGGTTSHPFLCPSTTDGSTASTIVGGTVNGVSATNLSLTISATGTKYVYLDVTYTAGVTTNGYVIGYTGSPTCALATGSSVPSDTTPVTNGGTAHIYRQIAAYASGVKTSQAILTSMQFALRDDGTGASKPLAIWVRA
jgi:hypothetical protein